MIESMAGEAEQQHGRLPRVLIYRDRLVPRFERFILDQADALRRYEPRFAGSYRDPSFARQAVLLSEEGRHRLREIRLKALRDPPGDYLQRLRATEAALVHAHFGPDGFFALPIARRLGTPLIVTFHGYDATMRPTASPGHVAWAMLRGTVLRRSRILIAVSRYLANRLADLGAPPDSIRVCPIGIDTTFFTPSPGLPRRDILYVGRLVENKGVDILIKAVACTRTAHPDLELTVIGDGPLRPTLQRQAAALHVPVRFLGGQPRNVVRDHLRRSLLMCLPAVRARSGAEEAFGLAALEAQACGTPVVASRSGGIPEAIDDEVTGLLVPPRDVVALAAALDRLVRNADLRERLATAARAGVVRKFDLAIRTAELENIYDEAVATTRS